MRELCGVPTPNGPCNMPKGHDADWHRHRHYEGIVWKLAFNSDVIEGSGMGGLMKAISRYKSHEHKLEIEVSCQ